MPTSRSRINRSPRRHSTAGRAGITVSPLTRSPSWGSRPFGIDTSDGSAQPAAALTIDQVVALQSLSGNRTVSRLFDGMQARTRTTDVIRRGTVTDLETGEVLPELTIADLVDLLPVAVRRALATLPAWVLGELGKLSEETQRWLLNQTEDMQLDIIDFLSSRTGGSESGEAGTGSAVARPDPGAMVPAGSMAGNQFEPAGIEIPDEIIDILLGRAGKPAWMRQQGGMPQPPWMRGPAAMSAGASPPSMPLITWSGPMALPPPMPVFQPALPEIPLIEGLGMTLVERKIGTITVHVPGFSMQDAAGIVSRYPSYSITNLVRMARLSISRPDDWKGLLDDRPPVASVANFAALAEALPSRPTTDLVALAALFDRRSLADIVTIATAGFDRPASDLTTLANAMAGSPAADIATLAQLPKEHSLGKLLLIGKVVDATHPAVDLAFVATCAPTASTEALKLVVELPNVTTLIATEVKAIATMVHREPVLFTTAASAQAALATPHISFSARELLTIIGAQNGWTLPTLGTVLNWAGFPDVDTLKKIVTHSKVDSIARLVSWLTNTKLTAGVTAKFGNQLLAVLQSKKIVSSAHIDHLLGFYDLGQIGSWLGYDWSKIATTRPSPVNGKVPATKVPGGGTTAGQRYTPDEYSSVLPDTVYHLSMSFSLEDKNKVARFTGLHVTWRPEGEKDRPSDPRQWFAVNNGRVAMAGTSPPGAVSAAMTNEATALMRKWLPRLNCHE